MLGRDKTLKGDDTKGEDIASGDEVVWGTNCVSEMNESMSLEEEIGKTTLSLDSEDCERDIGKVFSWKVTSRKKTNIDVVLRSL
jgi:hypothetical protein